MEKSLTLQGSRFRRFLSFLCGAGMIAASWLTVRHFYQANFPESIFKGAFCDISAFFNCDASAYSAIAHFRGLPLGFFGLLAGALVVAGTFFPSEPFERTNKSLSLVNALGVLFLLGYSVFHLKSLCLLCSGYYLFSLLSFFLFWKYGLPGRRPGFWSSVFAFSVKHLFVFGLIALAGAYGFQQFYKAKNDAQLGGVATRVVRDYYSLSRVADPSLISPFWTERSTGRFEEAPIRVIEYVDFLCPDCLFLYHQLNRLKSEYRGKINIAFQFFPLEGQCNSVVEKDLHPGACDLSYIAARDPSKFNDIHDEIFNNFEKAKDPDWRLELARRYGVEDALTDPGTRDLVRRIINTGAEYEKTSDKYSHGVRSTPTLIINNRMVIGTLPYAHLKAIVESLLEEGKKPGDRRFMENWVDYR